MNIGILRTFEQDKYMGIANLKTILGVNTLRIGEDAPGDWNLTLFASTAFFGVVDATVFGVVVLFGVVDVIFFGVLMSTF